MNANQMIVDEDFRKEVWKGCIPIMFDLNPNEVTTLHPPSPLYILAPRISYFPLVTNNVKKHFLTATTTIVGEMWIDYKGKPLKWHYPIGVLFDLLASDSDLPWCLSVHFQGFPTDQILRCPSEDTVKWHFTNVLKEANYIKHGDTSQVNSLSVSDSNDLWEGLKHYDFAQLWKANSKLLPDHGYKAVPVRLFIHSNPLCIQEAVSPTENGNQKTLGSVLCDIAGDIFTSPTTMPPKHKVVVQGTAPPLETPITWLADTFSHPDNFLYILVVPV